VAGIWAVIKRGYTGHPDKAALACKPYQHSPVPAREPAFLRRSVRHRLAIGRGCQVPGPEVRSARRPVSYLLVVDSGPTLGAQSVHERIAGSDRVGIIQANITPFGWAPECEWRERVVMSLS
jgi:hypothetical protein